MWPILPPNNYFRFLVTPISGFWFVTDANLYLVFADVFVLVCISLLCVTKAFSVICHSHRHLLIHRKCTKWSLVHPLQCAWICTASFLWPDTKGNLSRLTRKIRTCSVSKVDYRKVLDFLIKTNQSMRVFHQWSMQIVLTQIGNTVLKKKIQPRKQYPPTRCKNWTGGKNAAMDVKVTTPIKVTSMPGASNTAGFALDHAHKGNLEALKGKQCVMNLKYTFPPHWFN